MDFSAASSRHKKETEQRRKDAKRKLDEQRKQERFQGEMEDALEQRAALRLQAELEERRRLEEEAQLNDGVRWRAQFKPYPVDRTDDKIILPASALERLEQQGALDAGSVLTFSVAIPGGLLRTHAGVAEFTAEEGTVGLPPRVALCLTKGAGLQSVERVGTVELRFVRLERASKCVARLQPRGQGFHLGGMKAVDMDLEKVMMESLRGHTCLTEGDWLPIRNAGITYELVLKELSPAKQISIIDTELSVDILPSEQTEAEQREEELRKANEQAAIQAAQEQEDARLLHAQKKALSLGAEPAAAPDAVQVLVRLPEGGRMQRRFLRGEVLRKVFDWVESDASSRVESEQFKLVQRLPGTPPREFGAGDADKALSALGFGRQEALFLQRLEASEARASGGAMETGAKDEETPRLHPFPLAPLNPDTQGTQGDASAWNQAEQRAFQQLDRRVEADAPPTPTAALTAEPSLDQLSGQELVDVFEQLKFMGMPSEEAARNSKRFGSQLRELASMGFTDWISAVPLLEKYDGRLLRVVNSLTEMTPRDVSMGDAAATPPTFFGGGDAAASAPALAPAPAPAPSVAPAPAAAPKLGAGLPKERVAEEFKKLVAGGLAPNQAALRAIEIVKASVEEAAPAAAPDPLGDQLNQLATMGFTDVDTNRALLKQYAGRMDRVVDALTS